MVKYYLSSRPDKKGQCPIRVSISIRGTRLISTAGFNIPPSAWNQDSQQMKRGRLNWDKVPCDIVNARLKKIDSFFASYAVNLDHRPTTDELADLLAAVKGSSRRRTKKFGEEHTALQYFDRFVREESKANQWTEGTLRNWQTFRQHLRSFGKDVTPSDFDEKALTRFLEMLRHRTNMAEPSVEKIYLQLCQFQRWCLRKGYTEEEAILSYKPRFRKMPKPVIFLTREELMQLYHYEIPASGTLVKLQNLDGEEYGRLVTNSDNLQKARDLFCFCAFTSLRYSDAVSLKKSDISGNIIRVVTKKTSDSLEIDLNDCSKAILNKYMNIHLPCNAALPFLTIPVLDNCCKVLGELCGFNEPVTRIVFRGGSRTEMTMPKWKLLSSHAGRRTFICYALSLGIPPDIVMKWTGHSDYKAMKPYIEIAESTRVKAMAKINSSLM